MNESVAKKDSSSKMKESFHSSSKNKIDISKILILESVEINGLFEET